MLPSLFAAFLLFLADDPTAPRVLTWADLVPEGEQMAQQGPVDHEGGAIRQTGSTATVNELDGVKISMPGYMLPLDYTEKGMVTAFLLVPYYGACIHVPPPPPNQIVYVDTQGEAVKSRGLWDPVTVTGTMTVRMNINGLGDAAYTLLLDDVEAYNP